MKGKVKELIGKLIIYLSRKNYSQDKIKHSQKKFLYVFLPIFIVTTFRFNFIEGGISVSANVTFLIINLFILSLLTLIFYLSVSYFTEVRVNYLSKLFKYHDQVVCAYSDTDFGDTVYKIEKNSHISSYGTNVHIHTISGKLYQFDDWRSFKFVGIKESRKLKLERLKTIIDGN